MVANEVLYRKDLSWKAKGLYAYLFSKPDGWDFSADRIKNDGNEGRFKVLTALRELEKVGLLSRSKNGDGRVDYILKYSEQPIRMENSLFDPKCNDCTVQKLQGAKIDPISNKDKESNKDIAAVAARAQKGKKNAEKSNEMIKNYNFDEYLKSMEDNPARHIQVIAFYFKKKKLRFKTLQEVQSAIRRHLRAAREVANFDDDAIVNAYKKADREYPNLYTVETLLKVLTR